MTFEKAVEIILDIEKGYVFDSHDPGGETNWGISKRSYPHLDIKNLTREEAIQIYFQDFWQPLKMLLIPERLRLCLFDCAINQGHPRAIKLFQGAVGVQQDGVMGPITYNAAKLYPWVDALSNFVQLRLAFYGKQPNWVRYGEGWSKRLIVVAMQSVRG